MKSGKIVAVISLIVALAAGAAIFVGIHGEDGGTTEQRGLKSKDDKNKESTRKNETRDSDITRDSEQTDLLVDDVAEGDAFSDNTIINSYSAGDSLAELEALSDISEEIKDGQKDDSEGVARSDTYASAVAGGDIASVEEKSASAPVKVAPRLALMKVAPVAVVSVLGEAEVEVEAMQSYGMDLVNAKESNDWTPLELARFEIHSDVVSLLEATEQLFIAVKRDDVTLAGEALLRGANVNAKEFNGWTPLHYAANDNSLDVVELLLAKGANVTLKDNVQYTPFDLACFMRHWQMATRLDKAAGGNGEAVAKIATEKLFEAAKVGGGKEVKEVKSLINFGADVNKTDQLGWTPLHPAAGNGYMGIVQSLIYAGADANAKDNDGKTPLHYAAGYDRLEVVRFLLDQGANVDEKDSAGRTPLYYAVRGGYLKVVELLGAAAEEAERLGRQEAEARDVAAVEGAPADGAVVEDFALGVEPAAAVEEMSVEEAEITEQV